MSEDRDDHLYTVGILIIAIALMMFIENKSSCSFSGCSDYAGTSIRAYCLSCKLFKKKKESPILF